MNKFIAYLGLVLLVMCSACLNAPQPSVENRIQVAETLWADPEHIPVFIKRISIDPLSSSGNYSYPHFWLCVSLDSRSVWEPGLSLHDEGYILSRSIQININGDRQNELWRSGLLLSPAPLYDDEANIIAWIPVDIKVCTAIPAEKIIPYNVASVVYVSPAGRTLAYSWALQRIDEKTIIFSNGMSEIYASN